MTTNEHPFLDVSKEAEQKNLLETLNVIANNIQIYGTQVSKMGEDIERMIEQFRDDNPELINTLENTMTLHDHMKRALERNLKAQNKPYFGRIIFEDEILHKKESFYIGRGGISKDATNLVVIDWRAPVANAYYENGLGKCSYTAPDGSKLSIDLELKRTYEIEQGKLLNYFDTEVVSNDELLTKYLSKNKEAVLGEIVATIQQEQNDIIRRSPYHNVIVQGVAGSGKTTVAMHRISYILYNYEERFKPADFYIIGSNRLLLNYITSVLPDLDVYGVKQMTMEQLFVRLLYEDWDENKYHIKQVDKSSLKGVMRSTKEWFEALEAYCRELEWNTICRESIYLNPMQFVEGIQDGVVGVYDRSMQEPIHLQKKIVLVEKEAVERYISQNQTISLQSKINTLNERLETRIKDEFICKDATYTDKEKKAILRAYRNKYGAKTWKKSIFAIYKDFLTIQKLRGHEVDIPKHTFDIYDLAALAYIYKRIKETDVISEAHHIVIDEAQDQGIMAYSVLKYCIKDCTYTIMGDVSQNIHFGYGLSDWEDMKQLFLVTDRAKFDVLKKSYRNTIEISNFASNILYHGSFSVYPIEPIIRHGKEPSVIEEKTSLLYKRAADICKTWQKNGLETIAIVCRDQEMTQNTIEGLSEYIEVKGLDLEKAEFGKGILVLPVEYTKGLEFDAVLILNPTRTQYPVDDGHAKLLYVAATRALHELCILHDGNVSGLIVDPIPNKKIQHIHIEEDIPKKTQHIENKPIQAPKPQVQVSIVQPKEVPITQLPKPAVVVSTPVQKPVAPNNKTQVKEQMGTVLPKTAYTTYQSAYGTPKVNSQPAATIKPKPALVKPKASKNTSGNAFGDIPDTSLLRTMGHAKIDASIMWMKKQEDGLYLQSRYGLMRISPIKEDVIRITFSRVSQLMEQTNPKLIETKQCCAWKCKDSSKMVELWTRKLYLQIDKMTGAIRYYDTNRTLLLSERNTECRMTERDINGKMSSRVYWEFQRGEKLYAHRIADKFSENLRNVTRYISHGQNKEDFPLLVSEKGYGVLFATDFPAFFCDIMTYGSYVCIEEPKLDYYFIAGQNTPKVLTLYNELKK